MIQAGVRLQQSYRSEGAPFKSNRLAGKSPDVLIPSASEAIMSAKSSVDEDNLQEKQETGEDATKEGGIAPDASITTLADALGMPTGARGHGHLGGLLSGRLGFNRYEVLCTRQKYNTRRNGWRLTMLLLARRRLATRPTLGANATTPSASI